MCSHSVVNSNVIFSGFSRSRFGFEGGIWVLIAPVPGHCILVTLITSAGEERADFVRCKQNALEVFLEDRKICHQTKHGVMNWFCHEHVSKS